MESNIDKQNEYVSRDQIEEMIDAALARIDSNRDTAQLIKEQRELEAIIEKATF